MHRGDNTEQLLSGIFATQNQAPAEPDDRIDLETSDWVCQEFLFPSDYIRGEDTETAIPEFSGVQVFVKVTDGFANTAGLDWRIDRYLFGSGWTTEAEGEAIQSHVDGDMWFDIYFDELIRPTELSLTDKWRFCIRGRPVPLNPAEDLEVPYDGAVAIIDDHQEHVRLLEDRPYTFSINGTPSILTLRSNGKTYYSTQQGVEGVYFSNPNPLATSFVSATDVDGDPIQVGGNDVSLLFRLLGLIADEGVDFLGNAYRGAIRRNRFGSIESTFGEESDSYWLSKPNPSRFAVENLYFDVRDSDGNPQVIDQVLVDPITSGVYFQMYYTEEEGGTTTNYDWDNRLWRHVPKTFRAVKRESHVLPEPIVTKYIKIEFSHLQPKLYGPGEFQQPIRYIKHPKWVLDYFLIRTDFDQLTSRGNQFVPRQVGITYSALDLAYNYYLDDLKREPELPFLINPEEREAFASEIPRDSSRIDADTLRRISLILRPYQEHPAFSTVRYLLSESIATDLSNYPVELSDPALPVYDVSAMRSANKDAVIFEASHPVMFYYIPCRHRYKEVEAKLTYNRAYFVGIRQIAFSRERYTVAHDTPAYVETMGDGVNIERSDFVRRAEGLWMPY